MSLEAVKVAEQNSAFLTFEAGKWTTKLAAHVDGPIAALTKLGGMARRDAKASGMPNLAVPSFLLVPLFLLAII